jgi:hypothetical protein
MQTRIGDRQRAAAASTNGHKRYYRWSKAFTTGQKDIITGQQVSNSGQSLW